MFFCCSIQALTSADVIFCNNFIQPNLKKDFYLEFSIKGLHNSPKSVEHDKSFLPMLPELIILICLVMVQNQGKGAHILQLMYIIGWESLVLVLPA